MALESMGSMQCEVHSEGHSLDDRTDIEGQHVGCAYTDGGAAWLVSWKLGFVQEQDRQASTGALASGGATCGASSDNYDVVAHVDKPDI